MSSAIAEELPVSQQVDATPPEDNGVRPYTWTVESYYRAYERGAFGDARGLELIEGEIIQKVSPQLTPHAQGVHLTQYVVAEAFGADCHVRSQSPLDIGARTEPEPDVMVIRGKVRDYDRRKPKPSDVALLIEIADSSVAYDCGRKAAVYAGAGIEDYWVLSVGGRWLEVRRGATPLDDGSNRGTFTTVVRYAEYEVVSPLHAAHATVRVADLLPALGSASDEAIDNE